VALEGLSGASDRKVWEFARTRDFIIVTADADFYELVTTYGLRPRSSGCGDGTILRRPQSNY